jgi:hypothetical protein
MTAVGPGRASWQSYAIAAVAGLVPVACWLWQPGSLVLAVLLRSVAFVAALHGLGRLAGSLAGDEDAPTGLAIVWGLAIYLGFAGLLMSVHWFGPAGRAAVIAGGCVVGAGWAWRRSVTITEGLRSRLRAGTVAIAIVVTAFAAFSVLAAAGHWQGPFVDAETSYLGQIRRLADTGGLDDAVGFPRATGLGGQIALAAIVDGVDARAGHLVDRGILFVVAMILVVTTIRRRHGIGFALLAVPMFMLAIPAMPDDMAPRWSLVVLILGAALTLDRARERQAAGSAVLVLITVAAAITLRHAAAVFAVVLIAALVRTSRTWPRPVRWRVPAAVLAIIILPYVVAMARASAGPDPRFVVAGVRFLTAAGLAGVVALLFALAVPRTASTASLRAAMLAACAGIAGAGLLAPSAAALWQGVLPFAIAAVLLLCILTIGEPSDEEAPGRPALGVAVIITSLVGGALALARFPAGPLSPWPSRVAIMINDARALGEMPRGAATAAAVDYAAVQHTVPAGVRLAIWVDRPELVDHHSHAIIDLRTPGARLDRRLATVQARFVLVSVDALGPLDLGTRVMERGPVALLDLQTP